MDEPWKYAKWKKLVPKCCIFTVLFIWNILIKQILSVKKLVVFREFGTEGVGVTAEDHEVSLGSPENVLKLVAVVVQYCEYTKNRWNMHFRYVNFPSFAPFIIDVKIHEGWFQFVVVLKK